MKDSRFVRRLAPALLFSVLTAVALLPATPAAAQYLAIKSLALSDGNQSHSALVQDAGGMLYGTATFGGAHSVGSVFSVDTSGNLTVLHSFSTTDGGSPYAGLVLGQGFLYGTTETGGTNGFGTVFKIGTDGNNFSTIHNFDGMNEGGNPFGGLVQGSDTTLYGVTRNDGANGFGTVFTLDITGSTYNVIHTFGSTATDGSNPYAGLLLASDGFLYGTTEKGNAGSGFGTVFRMNTTGTTFSTIYTFKGPGMSDGQDPQAPLIDGGDGLIYGTTLFGGTGGSGTAYRLRTDGTSYQVIHAFTSTDGTDPEAALTRIVGGLLYGTTSSGSTGGGTIFRMTITGALFGVAHTCSSTSGSSPRGAVVQGQDLALYGTTSNGGSHSVGVVYQLVTPTVVSISPTSGIASGGTAITITGTGFQSNAVVSIGGVPATSVVIVDDKHVTAVTPGLPPGTLDDVAVTNTDDSIGFLQGGWFADFLDVPQSYLFHGSVEKIVRAFITTGCGAGNFCPEDPVTRDAMAKFLLVAKHGPAFFPPNATGTVFCDVSVSTLLAKWIEELKTEGIASGAEVGNCGDSKTNYHPTDVVTRDAMAKFLLLAKHGAAYSPPAPTGNVFCDVTVNTFLAKWIEEMKTESITSGCDNGACGKPDYCPSGTVTRGEMAKFLRIAFSL